MEKTMTRQEMTDFIYESFDPVKKLSDKEKGSAILLRHKELDKKVVMRNYPEVLPIYDYLLSVRCDSLPEVYEVYKCSDGEIVLEEYVKGITLKEMLEVQFYTFNDARKIIYKLCTALETIHANNFVHRDIKPDNVIIPDNGVCKLIDFDASRTVDISKNGDTTYLGTVGYASPEQYGISQSDARSDIYALGVLLNIMLTGNHPSKMLAKGKAGKIVGKCTHVSPEKRFDSVRKLQEALY